MGLLWDNKTEIIPNCKSLNERDFFLWLQQVGYLLSRLSVSEKHLSFERYWTDRSWLKNHWLGRGRLLSPFWPLKLVNNAAFIQAIISEKSNPGVKRWTLSITRAAALRVSVLHGLLSDPWGEHFASIAHNTSHIKRISGLDSLKLTHYGRPCGRNNRAQTRGSTLLLGTIKTLCSYLFSKK